MPRALFLLLAIVVGSPALGEEVKEIPLEEVWAYKMPGTRQLTDAEKGEGFVSKEGPVLREIRQALKCQRERVAGPAFLVQGSGRNTLPKVLEVLRGYLTEEEPSEPKAIKSGEEVTLVFFAYRSGSYFHLEKVEIEGNAIKVRYRFVRHITLDLSEHIALIPLGKLEPGK